MRQTNSLLFVCLILPTPDVLPSYKRSGSEPGSISPNACCCQLVEVRCRTGWRKRQRDRRRWQRTYCLLMVRGWIHTHMVTMYVRKNRQDKPLWDSAKVC